MSIANRPFHKYVMIVFSSHRRWSRLYIGAGLLGLMMLVLWAMPRKAEGSGEIRSTADGSQSSLILVQDDAPDLQVATMSGGDAAVAAGVDNLECRADNDHRFERIRQPRTKHCCPRLFGRDNGRYSLDPASQMGNDRRRGFIDPRLRSYVHRRFGVPVEQTEGGIMGVFAAAPFGSFGCTDQVDTAFLLDRNSGINRDDQAEG